MDLDKFFKPWEYDPLAVIEPDPWFLEPWWMAGKINAVFGPEKAGKSRLIGWLLASAYADKFVLDVSSHDAERMPKRWLYLAGEEKKEWIAIRTNRYIERMGGPKNLQVPWTIYPAAGMGLEHPSHRRWLLRKMQEHKCDGLIIEPMRRVHGGSESSNDEVAALHNDLRNWTNELDITVLLCHHTGKLNEYADMDRIATWSRGASDLATLVDTATFLEQKEPRKKDGTRILRCIRAGRHEAPAPITIVDLPHDMGFFLKAGSR